MKVLDLQCQHGHAFEGWFAGEDEFARQLGCGLIECPVCADHHIHKTPSAPRLNLGAGEPSPAVPVEGARARQAHWLGAMRQSLASAEDVGERFADEARRIHHGESEQRGIRGRASTEQTLALLEEGIPVLPLPEALKQTLQ